MKPSRKENILRMILFAISFSIFAVGVFKVLSRPPRQGSSSQSSSSSITPTATPSPAPSSEPTSSTIPVDTEFYEITLGAGIYTGGIDLPVGNYDISLVSGSGSVFSSNFYTGGLSENFAVGKTETFKNASIQENVTLTVSGAVTILLRSEHAAVSSMKPRTETEEIYPLSRGNYIAGEDFPIGTYTIRLIDGEGSLYSQNMPNGGLDESFGENGIVEFKNANLTKEGTLLSLSGISVELVKMK